jgi:ribonuclease R
LHTSTRERVANDAEREIERIKKAQFMADKVGETFDALVFSVSRQGFFVELLDHFVEGFVPFITLTDGDYEYHERTHSLIGRRRRFQLGSKIRVRLDRVDMDTARLVFSAVGG